MENDDGVGYGDYLEQLTYLLFLKRAHEFSKSPRKNSQVESHTGAFLARESAEADSCWNDKAQVRLRFILD